MKTRYRSRGFSVIEMILYMGLLSGFLVVMTDMFFTTLNVKTESEASSALEQDGRYLISRLVYDIHRASSIVTPSTLGSTSNSLELDIGPSKYSYSSSFRNLYLKDNLDTQRLNSNRTDVTFFSVKHLGNNRTLYPNIVSPKDTLQINFTLVATASAQHLETRSFQTTVGLR